MLDRMRKGNVPVREKVEKLRTFSTGLRFVNSMREAQ